MTTRAIKLGIPVRKFGKERRVSALCSLDMTWLMARLLVAPFVKGRVDKSLGRMAAVAATPEA